MNPPHPDLLRVKLLITEATYIDDEVDRHGQHSVEKARDRGHSHLHEFVQNAHIFDKVENILLVHFSDKYSSNYVRRTVYKSLPNVLKNKVHVGTIMKDTLG